MSPQKMFIVIVVVLLCYCVIVLLCYCYCYCVVFFILLRGLVVSPEDGLAAPFVAVVVAIALSVAPAINKFLSIKPFNNNKIIKPSKTPPKTFLLQALQGFTFHQWGCRCRRCRQRWKKMLSLFPLKFWVTLNIG